MSGITYTDGMLKIHNDTDEMGFPCDDVFAAKILDAVRLAIAVPMHSSGNSKDENVPNSRDAVIADLRSRDYVEVGDTDGITLFVGYPGYKFPDGYLIIFTYVSKQLPNKNGSTQVNVLMTI